MSGGRPTKKKSKFTGKSTLASTIEHYIPSKTTIYLIQGVQNENLDVEGSDSIKILMGKQENFYTHISPKINETISIGFAKRQTYKLYTRNVCK